MIIRRITNEDLPVYTSWHEKRGKDTPPISLTGSEGFVVERDGVPSAIGFLLMTNTTACFLEYMQTNPDLPSMTQGRAMLFLVDAMIDVVRSMGYRAITGFVEEGHTSLKGYYDRIGGKTTGRKYEAYFMEV